MMKRLILLLAFLSCSAQADTLYKCQGPDGRTTYTNQKSGKNCEIVSEDKPVSTFSAPARKPRQATPADFPRVNGEQQKARDDDRRAILEQELANEQKQLDAAKTDPAAKDKAQLHERNIESIRRELANLK
jgi:hypothetical protein